LPGNNSVNSVVAGIAASITLAIMEEQEQCFLAARAERFEMYWAAFQFSL
jgi:hypothetical protein